MMNHSRSLPHRVLFLLSGSLLLLILLGPLGPIVAQGATYYVATTGSDSNPGTSDRPWRNPQRCTKSPIKAGDTCIVRTGTYTDTDKNGVTVYVSGSSAAGTASQPITIKSEKPLGASIIVPSTHGTLNAGFYIARPYYIIEGFNITGGSKAGAGHDGILFTSYATGGTARHNAIHHIGRTICSNSGMISGILVGKTSNVLIERNRFYTIGRRRNGENGCSTTLFQQDHGIYASGSSNLIVRRNIFYDTNRGYPIHVYGSTTTTNLAIYHNTLSGRSPTGKPVGQIMLSRSIKTASIRNNVSSDAQGGMVHAWSLTGSNISVTHNLSDTLVKSTSSVPGATFSNNMERTNPGFFNKSGNDFRLTSSSAAINRGTTSGVPTVPDGRPDISAYEYSLQNNISSPLTPTGVGVQ